MADAFCEYELRTTDLDAAQAFYAAVANLRLERAGAPGSPVDHDDRVATLSPLPERAIARGAPAHWLGHIGVRDVEAPARRLVALGGEALGPPRRTVDGAALAILRDPFGAIVALRSTSGAPRPARRSFVAWHQLHAPDGERALAVYCELFGWSATETMELPEGLGSHLAFSWEEPRASVGSVVSIAGRPGVHPHWVFYFGVEDIDASLTEVRRRGGDALVPLRLPEGEIVAYCEDPQGAAFALHQAATPRGAT